MLTTIQGNVTNEVFVCIIENFPNLFFGARDCCLPLSPSEDNSLYRFFQPIKTRYINTGYWLKYLLLNDVSILPELKFTNKKHYKIFSDRTMAWLKFCQEIYFKNPTYLLGNCPLVFTVLLEEELFSQMLDTNGFYGGKPAPPPSKRKLEIERHAEMEWLLAVRSDVQVLRGSSTYLDHLKGAGYKIAQEDIAFRYSHYSDFLKAEKRFYTELRKKKTRVHQMKRIN